MTYKPSEARYEGGGQVKYLVYKSPQPLRDGRKQQRTRLKRPYFPAEAQEIKLETPGELTKRTGRQVHGVRVSYRYRLSGARARRGPKRYEIPERWAHRAKIVEVPEQATDLRLTSKPPEGPRMAVA